MPWGSHLDNPWVVHGALGPLELQGEPDDGEALDEVEVAADQRQAVRHVPGSHGLPEESSFSVNNRNE